MSPLRGLFVGSDLNGGLRLQLHHVAPLGLRKREGDEGRVGQECPTHWKQAKACTTRAGGVGQECPTHQKQVENLHYNGGGDWAAGINRRAGRGWTRTATRLSSSKSSGAAK